MANRYTCHLDAVLLPDGRIQVTYQTPGMDHQVWAIDLVGPAVVPEPAGAQTREKHQAWLSQLLRPHGPYDRLLRYRADGGPPIEVEEIPDVGSVALIASLQPYEHTFIVNVQNVGTVPAQQLSVWWVSEYEKPQPDQSGLTGMYWGGPSIELCASNDFGGTLEAGETAAFLLLEDFLPGIKGQVAGLSTERYRIAVRCGDQEVCSIDGGTAGGFIEGLG